MSVSATPVTPGAPLTSFIVPLLPWEACLLSRAGPGQVSASHGPNTTRGGPDSPEEVAPGQALLSGLGAAHSEAQPLGRVRPPLCSIYPDVP